MQECREFSSMQNIQGQLLSCEGLNIWTHTKSPALLTAMMIKLLHLNKDLSKGLCKKEQVCLNV